MRNSKLQTSEAGQTPAWSRPVLNIRESADFLRVSVRTVHQLVSDGKLRRKKVGGRTVFKRADLERLVA